MRIVGGTFAGRDLTSPADRRVRPTAEHMRSALLELLEPDVGGARILDLYAGTGALGLEAISRGAVSCDFVEWRPASLLALKGNINRFKLKTRTRVFRHDAIHFAEAVEPGRYDIAFCDPPYESRQLDWVIRIWEDRRFARVLAVEHAVTHVLPPGHSSITSGGTRFTIYREPSAPGAPAPVTVTIADPNAAPPPDPGRGDVAQRGATSRGGSGSRGAGRGGRGTGSRAPRRR